MPIRRRTSTDRALARRKYKIYARKVKHRANGRLTTKPRTSRQRSAVKKLSTKGFYRKVSNLRSSEDIVSKLSEGTVGHPDCYIDLILEAAAEIEGAEDAREFASYYLGQEPWYTGTQAGICALAFERYMAEEHDSLFGSYVETVVNPNDETFLVIFDRKLTDSDWTKLDEKADFIDLEVLVEVGDEDSDDRMISDVTILEATPRGAQELPVKTEKPEPDSSVGSADVIESLRPRTASDYRAAMLEGGVSATALTYLYNQDIEENCLVHPSGAVVWEDPHGVLWTLAGEKWKPLEESILRLEEVRIDEMSAELLKKYAVPGKSLVLPDNQWWTIKSRDMSANTIVLKLSDYAKKDGVESAADKSMSWDAFAQKAGKSWGIAIEGKQYGPSQDKEKRNAQREKAGKRAAPGAAKAESTMGNEKARLSESIDEDELSLVVDQLDEAESATLDAEDTEVITLVRQLNALKDRAKQSPTGASDALKEQIRALHAKIKALREAAATKQDPIDEKTCATTVRIDKKTAETHRLVKHEDPRTAPTKKFTAHDAPTQRMAKKKTEGDDTVSTVIEGKEFPDGTKRTWSAGTFVKKAGEWHKVHGEHVENEKAPEGKVADHTNKVVANNTSYGSFGTLRDSYELAKDEDVAEVHDAIGQAIMKSVPKANAKVVINMLDSKAGRHLADELASHGAKPGDKASILKAIEPLVKARTKRIAKAYEETAAATKKGTFESIDAGQTFLEGNPALVAAALLEGSNHKSALARLDLYCARNELDETTATKAATVRALLEGVLPKA